MVDPDRLTPGRSRLALALLLLLGGEASAEVTPLLGPDGPLWIGALTPATPAPIRLGRGMALVNPESGSLVLEGTDLLLPGCGPEISVHRRTVNEVWRWNLEDSLEETAEGLVLHTVAGDFEIPRVGEGTPPYAVGAHFLSEDIEAVREEESFTLERGGLLEHYDGQGNLLDRSDAYGNQLRYDYENGLLASVSAQDGRRIDIQRDPRGELSVLRAGDGREVYYEHQGELLLSVQSEISPRTRFLYDASNRVSAVLWSDSSRLRIQRDSQGRVSALTGPGTQNIAFSWTPLGVAVQSGNGSTTRIRFSDGGYEVSDSIGRVVRVGTQDGRITGWQDPKGLETRLVRNADGQITALESQGSRWGLEQSRRGFNAIVLPGGGSWRFERNSAGDVIGITDPEGRVQRFERSRKGQIHTVWRGESVLRLGRDSAGLVNQITMPTGSNTSLVRDASGRILGTTDSSGREIGLSGMRRGRPQSISTRNGGLWALEYDPMGRLLRLDSPEGGQLRLVRDSGGRIVRAGHHGGETRFSYGSNGRLTRLENPEGGLYRLRRNASGHLVGIDRPDGSQVNLRLDSYRELTAILHGHRTFTLQRDARGLPLSLGPLTWQWNIDGEWTGLEGGGVQFSIPRSAAGAVREIRIGETAPLAVTRDPQGRVIALGHGEHRHQLRRNAAGQVSGILPPQGPASQASLDDRGLVSSYRVGSHEMRLLRDATGRLLKHSATAGLSVSADRDLSGRVRTVHYPSGALSQWERGEELDQLTIRSSEEEILLLRTVRRDALGRSAVVEEGIITIPRWDPLGNMVALETGGGAWSWVPGQIEGPGDNLVLLDEQGAPMEASPPEGPAAWGVATETLGYIFDEQGRIESLLGDLDNLQLFHDGLGRLIQVGPSPEESWFLEWDSYGRLARIQPPDAHLITLVYGIDRLIGWEDGSGFTTLLEAPDGGWILSGPRSAELMTDETGAVRVEWFGGNDPELIYWTPLGFAQGVSRSPIGRGQSWTLFPGGPILSGEGAWDPISGNWTTRGWTPEWWTREEGLGEWPVLDGSADPWWNPEPWLPQSPWRDPLELLVALGALEPALEGSWTRLEDDIPPTGWLPSKAASPSPPLSPPQDAIPLLAAPLGSALVRAATSPIQPLDTALILDAILQPDFRDLEEAGGLFGAEWTWWLQGADSSLQNP